MVSVTLLLSLTILPLAEYLEFSGPENQNQQELRIWAKVIRKAILQIELWITHPEHANLNTFNQDLLRYTHVEYAYRLKRIEQLLASGPEVEVHHHDRPELEIAGAEGSIYLTDFMTSDLALELTLFERETLLALRREYGEFDVRTFRRILLRIDLRLMFLRSVQSQVKFKVHQFERPLSAYSAKGRKSRPRWWKKPDSSNRVV